MPRFCHPQALKTGDVIDLTPGAARHVQVLRLQPGESITLFGGQGTDLAAQSGEFEASITRMGRSDVQVQIGRHHPLEREAGREVHLLVGMPANERMDWLVEKATELGANSLQPIMTERSVLRLSGERATKKVAHWQSIAISACEQCGRNRVPTIHTVMTLADWLRSHPPGSYPGAPANAGSTRLLLSLQAQARPIMQWADSGTVTFLSGPEGGLSTAEEKLSIDAGFQPVSLGPRVLRAETAALAALTALTLT